MAETEKTPQNGFPTPWKWEKILKTAFQPLGNGRNASKRLSNPLEMKKHLKMAFQPLGNEKTPQNGFPTPWK